MQPIHTPGDVFRSTLELLERFCAISSPSGDLEGLNRAARFLAGELERRGLAVEIRQEAGAGGVEQPVLYARSSTPAAGTTEPRLLAIGHLDTVLPAAEPTHRDGRLWATGAIDMKGGLAALAGALDLLAARGLQPPSDLLLAVVPDEEVAGVLSQRVVEQLGVSARELWVLEPGQRRGDAETLVAGRRGMFDWRLDVRGRGAHAGNAYWQGRSALLAACAWCVEARALASRGPGPTINAARIVGGDESFVGDLEANAAMVGSSRQLNVVPDRATVEGEARFLRPGEGDALVADLAALAETIAAEHDLEIDFEPGPRVQPVDPDGPGRRTSQAAAEIAEKAGWKLEIEDDRGGISFSNFLPDPSAIPILDGLGPVGDGMHTRDEFLELESLDRRIALLAELLATET